MDDLNIERVDEFPTTGIVAGQWYMKKASDYSFFEIKIGNAAGNALVPLGASDYVPSTGTVLGFDLPRKYGYNGTPYGATSYTFNIVGASEMNVIKMLHSGESGPLTFTPPAGVEMHCSGGTFEFDTLTEYMFICHKNNAGEVVRISYSIAPNIA